MALAPRKLVEKELLHLLEKAACLFPKMKGKEKYVLYGPSEKQYASFCDPKEYSRYRGRVWEWQGLLGQKVPRFDNRIIAKCVLIPRLNVCKASDILNQEVTFLMSLKNMRYFDGDRREKSLSSEEMKELFESFSKTKKITQSKWGKYIQENLSGTVHPNQKEVSGSKAGGRSRFSRPALRILKDLLLSGKSPHVIYEEMVQQCTCLDIRKGLIKEDYEFLKKMPSEWENFHIPDQRMDDLHILKDARLRNKRIAEIINEINNPVVRHRLSFFLNRLEWLVDRYGQPDKVIIELVRDTKTGFMGKKNRENYQKIQNENLKKRKDALDEVSRLNLSGQNAIVKMLLFKEQNGIDFYTGQMLQETEIENYEIDHIYPKARGGSDVFFNKILTTRTKNQEKDDKTPYEWLHNSDFWEAFLSLVKENNLHKKKKNLLTSENADELNEKYADLAATAYVAKLCQRIVSLYLGWPHLVPGSERKILVSNGGYTAKIRRRYRLDQLLHPDLSPEEIAALAREGKIEEKNRDNPLHHSLDALVISMWPYFSESDLSTMPSWFSPCFCKEALDKVIALPVAYQKPELAKTIFGKRKRKNGTYCFVARQNKGTSITEYYTLEGAKKYVDKIFDQKIQNDFKKKLESDPPPTEEEWKSFIQSYSVNGSKLKKISLVASTDIKEGSASEYAEIGKVKGQYYKNLKEYKGQIVYKDQKGKWRVAPVYVFESVFQKKMQYKREYGTVYFFKSQQRIVLKHNTVNCSAGVYILKSIKTNGQVQLALPDESKAIRESLHRLMEEGEMRLFQPEQ
ncbi:MAG: type II CRISPR RNA-guided endonuclease Cas9 [Candidatus Ratteibacteria bacterium]